MERIKVKMKNISGDKLNVVPKYETLGSAGVDLRASLEQEIVLLAGETVKVPTGWAIQLPDSQVVALVFARSGLAANYGVALANGVGVIDSDYRGEIQILISNNSSEPYIIHHGDRIAQLLFMPVMRAEFEIVEDLEETLRGKGGFGSTG